MPVTMLPDAPDAADAFVELAAHALGVPHAYITHWQNGTLEPHAAWTAEEAAPLPGDALEDLHRLLLDAGAPTPNAAANEATDHAALGNAASDDGASDDGRASGIAPAVVLDDAAADPCVRNASCVSGAPGIRWCAHVPLRMAASTDPDPGPANGESANGESALFLCLLDTSARATTATQRRRLSHLAAVGARAVASPNATTDAEAPPASLSPDALSTLHSRVLEQVSDGTPLPDVLDRIVAAIEERAPTVLGSIMLYDAQQECMRVGAGPRLPAAYCDAIDGLPIGPNVGSCGAALHHGKPAIASRIATDRRWRDYRDEALSHGLRACWSVPILGGNGAVLGTFALYRRAPGSPSAAHRTLLDAFQALACVAIERHQHLSTLRKREARFRTLAHAVPGVIYNFIAESDGAYRSTFVSQQAETMLGIDASPDGFFERFVAHVPEHARDDFRTSVEGAVQATEPWIHETPFVRPDGTRIWIQGRAAPAPDADPLAFHGVLLDVTAEKNAQADLQNTLSRTQSVLQTTNEGYMLYDTTGAIVDVNPAYCRIVGRSREALLGMNIADLEVHDDPEGLHSRFRRFAEDVFWVEGVKRFSTQHRHHDGHPVDVEISVGVLTAAQAGTDEPLIHAFVRDVTDRLRMEDALQERNEYLAVTLRSIGDAVIATDADGRVTEMNAVAETLTGWPRNEAEGRPLSDVFVIHNAQTGNPVENPVDRVLREGTTVGLANHTVLTARDGTTYQIADSAAPIRPRHASAKNASSKDPERHEATRTDAPSTDASRTDNGHSLLGVVLVFRDITQQYERREALRKSRLALEAEREQLAMALTGADLGLWDWNVNTDEVRYSERWAEMLGYTLEETEGTEAFFASHTHPEDLPRVKQAAERHAAGEIPYIDLEIRMRHHDGTWRWILDRGKILEWNDDGTPRRMVGTHMDITERKEAEHALRRRERNIQELYSAVGTLARAATREELAKQIAQLVTNTFGYAACVVRWLDDDALRPVAASYTDDTVVSRPRPSYPVDGDAFPAEAFRTGETIHLPRIRSDERERIGGVTAAGLLQSAAYVPVGHHGSITVTAHRGNIRPFDLHLLELLAHAATGVLDRIENEATLHASREEAERANRLKSTFLANMSHEIRTPLTSILGFAEEIERLARGAETADPELTRRFAQLIGKSGRSLMETLNGVLNLSRLESGSMALEAQPVDLSRLAAEGTDQFRRQARNASVDLTATLDRSVRARVNPGGVRIIVQNLVSNAIKFTPEGGRVTVRVSATDSEAVLAVEDTGIGMHPDDVPTLLQPFRQASEGLSREYEGTGLGLAVTRRVVEQMGGTLTVDTAPGDGTCFTVGLPLVDLPPLSGRPHSGPGQ